MLIPKASHLVERVAERLLRAGALDDSAAQLLESGGAPAPEVASAGAAEPVVAGAAAAWPTSGLFAPPPAAVPAPQPIGSPVPQPATGLDPHAAASPDPQSAVGLTSPNPTSPNLASPSIPGRTRLPGETFGQADWPAMPPQALPAIDAVALERAGMVDWSRTRTRISEEFRLVQRQILRSAFGPGAEPGFSNLLLVTSARPGEGKSFMATNLSGSIARQGDHHVLLVDADSKRDSICYALGLAQARGLLDLAANPKLDPSPLIVRTPIERLSVLPVGRERERSAELFSTKEMTRLIQSLGRRYADRLLVLDAPPCLSTSDPAVLSQVVGQILFVVEADRTQRDEIEASLDLIQACPTITLVLNKQQVSSRYTFGAYSSYYSS
jgi:protein-tyrosine kinase